VEQEVIGQYHQFFVVIIKHSTTDENIVMNTFKQCILLL